MTGLKEEQLRIETSLLIFKDARALGRKGRLSSTWGWHDGAILADGPRDSTTIALCLSNVVHICVKLHDVGFAIYADSEGAFFVTLRLNID